MRLVQGSMAGCPFIVYCYPYPQSQFESPDKCNLLKDMSFESDRLSSDPSFSLFLGDLTSLLSFYLLNEASDICLDAVAIKALAQGLTQRDNTWTTVLGYFSLLYFS